MALKNFTIDLTNVKATGVDTISVSSAVSVNSTEVGKLSAAQSYLDMGSFGKITAVSADTVDVKIAAGVESGVYDINQGDNAKVRNFDASAVTAGMKIDLGVVTVNGGTVNTGFGDDVISVSGSDAEDVNVYGGKGADVFVLTDATNKAVVQDYSYAEGDVVSVTGLNGYALSNTGVFADSATSTATVKAADADGLYKVKMQAAGVKYDVITAQAGEDVSVTLSQDAGIVDVSGAKSAVVDLGQGNDTINAANTALTLKVGRADGTANELKQVLGKDDTLALLNGDLGIVAVSVNGDLTFGDTTIQKAVDVAQQSEFKVSFDDGKTTGVAAAGKSVITVKASDLPDFYVGIGNGTKVSVQSTTTDDVVIDLSDNSKIAGAVNYIDATNAKGNATLKGRADVATTIETGAVAAGMTKEIYTGTGKDSVGLGASAGVFKVHLSNAEGNADTVTGFDVKDDILVLDDVAKLAVDTFSVTSSDLLLGTSKASIAGAAATVAGGINVKVQLSGADKAINVALAKSSSVVTADQDTDVVLNVGDTVPAGVSYAGATFGEAFTVDLNDTDKYIGTFVSVNASNAGKAALVLGKDGVDNNVTIDGGSVVWGGANSNDTLTINRDDVDGGSIVWTGATGGKDTLANYDGTKDVIYSYDRATWTNEAIKSDVTFDSVTSAVIINSADGSTLNIGTNAGENLLLMGTQMEVSKVAIASATSVAYAGDVNVYLSAKANTTVKVDNSAVAEGDSAVIDLSANNLMGAGKTYGDNITNIDASKSAGSFLLVGANVSGSKITGGQTMNVLYGGGNADQTMTGVAAARDLFWFGSTDGHDTIDKFDVARDVVYLWNTTDINDVKVAVNAAGDSAAVVFEATGSTLDINGANIANATFMVRDGADGYNYYTYDAENKAFVKKQ